VTSIALLFFLLALLTARATAGLSDESAGRKSLLGPMQTGVVVNDADPSSVQIAMYYQEQRRIPAGNVLHVSFPPGQSSMSQDEFARVNQAVNAAAPSQVQILVLTWMLPYRVDCMSITSAFAFGFDPRYCAASCLPTKPSLYYDSPSRRPFRDLRIRPAMMLAGNSLAEVKALIDRGVAADGAFPYGTAYLLTTSDKQRSTRSALFPAAPQAARGRVRIKSLNADFIQGNKDVMFYFTGAMQVSGLDTLQFLPGAIADHLTSMGGDLAGGNQMSAVSWLGAGATGSYGTVLEPCNFPQKFPNPLVAMNRYLNGETLIEAYWKSVAWPGQGLFIGEPLAAPFRRQSETVFKISQ
jgi:uncharacterized protein (TIGR03790 family)